MGRDTPLGGVPKEVSNRQGQEACLNLEQTEKNDGE
jgi:hypothetical protein